MITNPLHDKSTLPHKFLLLTLTAGMAISIQTKAFSEPLKTSPTQKVVLDHKQLESIAKSRGMQSIPPQMREAMLAAKAQALFHKLKAEIQQAAYRLQTEKYRGPLKESLAFAKSKGCTLDTLVYAHTLIQDGDQPFTGEPVPFVAVAIGPHKMLILQDGSTQDLP